MTEEGAMGGPEARQVSRRRRGLASRAAITLTCLALFLLLRIFNPLPAERLRDSASGRAIEIAEAVATYGEAATAPRVVTVDIDEATIARFGRWPLPAPALAELLDAVNAGGPAAVGFAYVFTGVGAEADGGARLVRSLGQGRVVLGTAPSRSRQVFDAGRIPLVPARLDDIGAVEAMPAFDRLMPIPAPLVSSAAGAALLTIQLSHSGIPRRLPTVSRYRGGLIPSLPVEMLRLAAGDGPVVVAGGAAGLRSVSVGGRAIATDPDGAVWFLVDPARRIDRVSALDILDGRVDRALFRASYVLVGSTAAGVSSEHVSAQGGLLSGIDALAHALAALLEGRTYHYPVSAVALEVLIAVLLAAIAFLSDRAFGGRLFMTGGVAAFAALWAGSIGAVAGSGMIVDPGLLSLFAAVLYAALLLNKYRLARREAREVIAEKEKEVVVLREDTARVAVAAANPRLSIALSHELRQPLAATRNYLGAIRRLAGKPGDAGADRLSTYVEEANRQIASMTEIMNELAEIVRGDLTLMREEHLDEVLVEAITATIAAAGGDSVRFTTDFETKPPPVLLNRRQIQLVISNFTRNAIEAPRRQTELSLVLRIRARDAEWVEVSLADTAAGIPEGIRDRIFSRFETSKAAGSGIGLPLCRDIVHAHGGRIWFDTAPETGTTFHFTLRRAS